MQEILFRAQSGRLGMMVRQISDNPLLMRLAERCAQISHDRQQERVILLWRIQFLSTTLRYLEPETTRVKQELVSA